MTGYHCQFSRFLLKEFLVENKIRHCSLMSLIRGGNKICGREENKKKEEILKSTFFPINQMSQHQEKKVSYWGLFGHIYCHLNDELHLLEMCRSGYQNMQCR